jgi:predicted ATPase/DNA-binding SARP family transcriptional activator
VEVRVLGPVELVDGSSVVRLPRAERTVLAALAARVGERVPVDLLAEAVWPQQRPPSARKSLQVRVVRLRRVLGAAAIIERDGGYRLDPDHLEVDADRVAGLVAEARAAIRHGDPDVAVGLLAEAKVAFRGEPYEDVADGALPAGEAQRLQELRAAAVEEGFEAELARGCGERCIGDLEAYVQANPYRERAWGQLMHALYQAGRPANALAAYGRARVLLAAELGIEPGPALRDMERAVLAHDPRLHKSGVPPTGLGGSNLPSAVSPIIGRQLELATLEAVSLSERLVTLTGVGGIGKTRLALELAANTAGRDKFGPFFVDLAPIGDIELVPSALAAALGVRVEPNVDVMALVRSALADHTVAVVLDNCEHLLPGIAELVGRLLGSSPGLRVVATSRESLGVAGERVCPVDPLRVPPAAASTEEIENSDAGALFLARLPINLSSGPLSLDEVAAVASICRSVDGIPLGLELAAARSRTLSLPELAERIEHSINELAPPRHGVTARHRTMTAALDWGYQLLSPSAQTALRAMSVFAGGCELPAFAAVCLDDADQPAIDVLDELVRTSFAGADSTGERTRYQLLEPVRQYAGQLLDHSGDRADRHRRHLHYYLDIARGLRHLDLVGDTTLDDLRPELGNFRAALDWAASDRTSAAAGLALAARLQTLWTDEGHHQEGLSRLVGLLATGAGSPAVRSVAAYGAGFITADTGNDLHARALWEQALAEAQAGDDRLGEIRARRVLGDSACLVSGDVATARHHLEAAIQIATDEANDVLHARCTTDLANLVFITGLHDEAIHLIQEVLDGPAGLVPVVEMHAHAALGDILYDRGDPDAARIATTRALALAESENHQGLVMIAHLDLAAIECAAGALDESATHLAIAEVLKPDAAHGLDPAFLIARTDLALARGDDIQALSIAEEVVALEDGSYSTGSQGIANLRYLGDAQLAVGNASDALTTYQGMIVRASVAPYAVRLAEANEGCAAAAHALGDNINAHHYLASATQIRQRTRSQRLPRPAVDRHLITLAAERPASVTDGLTARNQ